MSRRALIRLAVSLFVAAALVAIAGSWWWALLGMTEDVGLAMTTTATTLVVAGAVAIGCAQ